jgi:hypothetical protein
VCYLLHPEPGFAETVSAARAMARRHLPLRAAKAAVERLLDKEEVTVEIPKVEDAALFEREMAALGIAAVQREPVEVTATQPDLARSR